MVDLFEESSYNYNFDLLADNRLEHIRVEYTLVAVVEDKLVEQMYIVEVDCLMVEGKAGVVAVVVKLEEQVVVAIRKIFFQKATKMG